MTRKNRLLRALSILLPAGALGASVALASTSAVAFVPPSQEATSPAAGKNVATRLQAIRTSVSALAADAERQSQTDPNVRLAWWGNGGFGPWRFGWGNGGHWHNGGWRNGGWGNGGWGNGGWHNWHNGWHNGWHNFWRNW
jgi:rSAM-associated Gly-rich repeat protein